jgi:hypothetical protein
MEPFKKKIWIVLIFICLITPVGIFLPEIFHSGNAWGEWNTEKVKDDVGYEPQGMKKNADLWEAPMPEYKMGSPKSLISNSLHYVISGITGLGIIALLTWLLFKYNQRHG